MADFSRTVDSELDEIVQVATQIVQESKASPPSLNGTTAPTSEEDNMDFDSDDDEDSKSNHSSSNQNSRRKRPKGDHKRSHHNVLERKRRDLIKDSFSKLRDSVPTLNQERASRAQILKKAADFIQSTIRRNENNKAEIDRLVKENKELESKHKPANETNLDQVKPKVESEM